MDYKDIEPIILEKIQLVLSTLNIKGTLIKNGTSYSGINPTRGDRKQGSFFICMHTGRWNDFATGDGGNIISLIAYVVGGGKKDYAMANKWIKDFIGTGGGMSDAEKQRLHQQHIDNKKRMTSQANEQAQKILKIATAIWYDCRYISGTDPSSLYLRDRKIPVPFNNQYPHIKTGNIKHTDLPYPTQAMVCPIYTIKGKLIGIHRTYLENKL